MKRAIVSDIHGNLEALNVVLADIRDQGIEEIYCLGDVIGYGPNPIECIDVAMGFDECVLGNHDQGALFDPEGFSSGAERAIFWTRQQLEASLTTADPDEVEKSRNRWRFLAELGRNKTQGDVMYVHGSARNPLNEYVFPEDIYNTRKIEKIFTMIKQQCYQGHTNVPGIFTEDARFLSPSDVGGVYHFGKERVMINVGSVGQPRDGDPRSSYVVRYDDRVEFRRLDYPVEVTADKIYQTPDLDDFLGDRLREGR